MFAKEAGVILLNRNGSSQVFVSLPWKGINFVTLKVVLLFIIRSTVTLPSKTSIP